MPSPSSQTYDPYQLIDEVAALLKERGLTAVVPHGYLGEAVAGAGKLLRALGVQPALDAVDAYKHTVDRLWDESQDVV